MDSGISRGETSQMPYFPVSKSFVSTEGLSKVIEAAYGLTNVQCQLIQASMRDVYRVTSGQQSHILFLYRHSERTKTEITAEWDFIDCLKTAGASVAPAVRQRNGELLLTIEAPEGTRYAVLGTFVEGQHLRHRYSAEAVRHYGQAIAHIHAIADTLSLSLTRPNHNFEFIVAHPLIALEPVLNHRSADRAYLHAVADVLQPRFATLPQHKPEFGLIHGDVIRANAQVSSGGAVTVLDFDLCGYGWRAYDVATYLQVAGIEESRQAFVDGYQEIRPLTDNELSCLPLFEAACHFFELGVAAMNRQFWGSAYLNETVLDAALEGVRRCMKQIN